MIGIVALLALVALPIYFVTKRKRDAPVLDEPWRRSRPADRSVDGSEGNSRDDGA